jgi:hypothetical protein
MTVSFRFTSWLCFDCAKRLVPGPAKPIGPRSGVRIFGRGMGLVTSREENSQTNPRAAAVPADPSRDRNLANFAIPVTRRAGRR